MRISTKFENSTNSTNLVELDKGGDVFGLLGSEVAGISSGITAGGAAFRTGQIFVSHHSLGQSQTTDNKH